MPLHCSSVRYGIWSFVTSPEEGVSSYKSVKRLAIPLLLWSAFFSFVVTLNTYRCVSSESIIAFLKLTFLTPTHNWFLFMLIGLYLVVPFLKPIVTDKAKMNYIIALWGVLAIIMPYLKNFDYFTDLTMFFNRFDIHLSIGYIGYFILGYKLSTVQIIKNIQIKLLLILGTLLFIILIAIATFFESNRVGHPSELYYNYLNPLVVVYSTLVFLMARILFDKQMNANKMNDLIVDMSKYSLGIYMFHEFILILLLQFDICYNIINPLLAIPFVSIVIYIISFLVIHLCAKNTIFKRYLL